MLRSMGVFIGIVTSLLGIYLPIADDRDWIPFEPPREERVGIDTARGPR